MPLLRCAILDDYQRVALAMADWRALAGRVEVRAIDRHIADEEALASEVGDCAILVAMRERMPFPASLLARLPKLQLLVTTGMRNAAIDLDAAARRGIVVCGTGGSADPPVELTWALILALARHLVEEHAAFRTGGPWQSTIGRDLHGRRLGVIGLGRIGTKVARIGCAFGMDVAAWSQHLTADRAAAAGARLAASKEELLESSDVVTIHVVLSERTRGLIGRAELRRMKPTALLVNTSRGAIVDEEALVEALENGWIAGAGVDVFNEEPLPAGHRLRSVRNLLATPHLGYVTEGNYRTFFADAVEDIRAFLDGSPIRVISAPGRDTHHR